MDNCRTNESIMMAFTPFSLQRRSQAFPLILAIAFAVLLDSFAVRAADYDIVYVRAPRYGDDQRVGFPEVTHPIDAPAGSDLVLLRPDGTKGEVQDLQIVNGSGVSLKIETGTRVYDVRIATELAAGTRRGEPPAHPRRSWRG